MLRRLVYLGRVLDTDDVVDRRVEDEEGTTERPDLVDDAVVGEVVEELAADRERSTPDVDDRLAARVW